jgi:hypothetical protein
MAAPNQPQPMGQPKIELPSWLPWATTACLAALVACLAELWFIEKARTQFLRDQSQIAETAMKGAQNQLEAERIVERRAVESVRAGNEARLALRVLLLSPPGATAAGAPALGAVVLDPADGRGLLRLEGGAAQPAGRDYQLWADAQGGAYPADCGAFHGSPGTDGSLLASFAAPFPVPPGCRFLLIDVPMGGARTLGEAQARGSIVLASLPYSPRIPNP